MRLDAAAIMAEADALDLSEIDLLADTWADRVPHAEFARLRRDHPVFWHEEEDDTGFWAITRHEDIVAISRDHHTFSMELGGSFIPTQSEEDLAAMRLSILSMDPPKHDRYRKLVSAGFTPRVIRRLMEAIDEHAAHTIDRIQHLGAVDFIDAVASVVPMEMICDMLGIPEEDHAQMRIWSDRLVGWDDPDMAVDKDVNLQAAADIFMYCNDLVAKRREHPVNDILSELVHAEVDGDRLDELELNLFFVTLVIAGNETTRNLIAHAMQALFDHPEQLELLRSDIPRYLPTAVDEMLRWGSSIQNFRRTATRDVELHGTTIKKGDKVVTFYLAGNFDERQYENPFEFRVDRENGYSHVAFGGGGIHFCLGSHLAKAEIGSTIREVITRLPDIRPAGPIARMRSDFINGIKRMPVEFTPVREPANA